MKAALLGTDHYQHEANPQTILRDTGIKYLRHMAGYIPKTMPVTPITLPHPIIFEQFTTNCIMTSLCGQTVTNCNPRAPLLMMAWLLVGSDNEFRVSAYATQVSFVRDVTFMLLRYALGERLILSTYYHAIMGNLRGSKPVDEGDIWNIWADETLAWVFEALDSKSHHAVKAVEALVWSVTRFALLDATALIQKQARDWCHLNDEDALLIIQWLFLDALNIEDKP
jgi:hypothetical protein